MQANKTRVSTAATRYVAAVPLIDVAWLQSEGIGLVLLDRDNTCVPRDTKRPPREVLDWLEEVRAAGIRTCVVSNNFHTDQVRASAEELGCDFVDHAMKPAPFALKAAMRRMGVGPERTVMVGDQVFTDVVAGNLAGVRTVLVRPQCLRDLWYTYIFRAFEALALRGKHFDGE